MNLGEKILAARKKAGLSQTDLADLVGVSRQSVSKWETGESSPEAGNLLPVARALNVTTDWLLSEDELPAPVQDTAPDWVDRLPKNISALIKQYGWIYCAKEAGKALIGLIIVNAFRFYWIQSLFLSTKLTSREMVFPKNPLVGKFVFPFNIISIVLLLQILFWSVLWLLLKAQPGKH